MAAIGNWYYGGGGGDDDDDDIDDIDDDDARAWWYIKKELYELHRYIDAGMHKVYNFDLLFQDL